MYVGGCVNTITIPQDLIAVNTTETIYGPTIFLAPVHVEGNLFVRGKLDKTDLNSLLENQVTLSGNEEIHADFTYKTEMHVNNLEVDKINDVLVSSIVTTTGNHEIEGLKTFSEDLNIGGSLQVRRINGIDLQYLDEHVTKGSSHLSSIALYPILGTPCGQIPPVAGNAPEGLSGSSVVYSWSYNMQKLEVLKEVLASLPSSVLWVDTGEYLFALFANEKTMLHQNYNWNNLYLEPVNVYLYHYHNLEWVQSINVRLAGETYVMAASNHLQLVYLLQWSGFAGFKVVLEISSAGVEHVHVYWSANEDLMVAVESSTGHTKILKAVIRGTAVTPIEGHPRYMDLEYFTNVSYFNNYLLKPLTYYALTLDQKTNNNSPTSNSFCN
ncbi:uncharacterized protein LOC143245588 [Tachypleus tridentatus]|uniref:uncharacterized protein LOC143245588 n=1 Tax=Tachypleus tridentatus TaxID=6853 RepID=UPI003FD3565E